MHYICCQPSVNYYTWQVELLINNFLNVGKIPGCNIHIVLGHYGNVPETWLRLMKEYTFEYGVNFYFYQDTRGNYPYIPSIYFHLMAKFLRDNPAMQEETLFLHDCDILFTKDVLTEFDVFKEGPEFYLSDTNSYINYGYVVSKGEQQFIDMCAVVGVQPDIVKKYNKHSGGGQYICKNLKPELFDKTEADSVKLYKLLCHNEPRYKDGVPIQKWTAGMWAFLWNIWLSGVETIVDKRLDFVTGTDPYEKVQEVSIYHNAGVTDGMTKTHFFKGDYINRLPFKRGLQLGNNGSKWYYEQVRELEVISIL